MEINPDKPGLSSGPVWLILAAIVAAGFILRLQAVVWEPLYFPDSTEYLHLAREIRSGEVFNADFDLEKGFAASRKIPMLYSLILSPLAGSKNFEVKAEAVTLVISMLGFLPLFLAARLLWDEKGALFAAAFYAINPYAIYFSGFVLTEPLFGTTLLALFYFSALAARKPSTVLFAAIGAAGALLYLTREFGLIYFVLALGSASIQFFHTGPGKRRMPAITGGIAVFALICSPYWLYIRARTGHWGLTVRMRTGEIAGLVGADPSGSVSSFWRRTAGNLFDYGEALFREITPGLMVLMGIGILAAFIRRRGRRENSLSILWISAWIAVLVIAYAVLTESFQEPRYLSPLLGLAAILAGQGAVAILPESATSRRRVAIQWLIAIIITVLVMAGGWTYMKAVFERRTAANTNTLFSSGAKEAAEDIRKAGLVPADGVLISRKPFLPYYVGCAWYYDHQTGETMPETREGLEKLLVSHQAGFLVIDSDQAVKLTPEIAAPAFGYEPLPGARVIYSRFFPELRKVITLYRLGEPERPLPDLPSAEAYLERAGKFYLAGSFIFALHDADRALSLNPALASAVRLKTQILIRFHSCAAKTPIPTLLLVPELLPDLVSDLQLYVQLRPNDQNARNDLHAFQTAYRDERSAVYALQNPNR